MLGVGIVTHTLMTAGMLLMACVGMAFMAAAMPANPYLATTGTHDHGGPTVAGTTQDPTPNLGGHLHAAGFAGTVSIWLASPRVTAGYELLLNLGMGVMMLSLVG
ncbi:MAG: hypothetical protein ACRDQ5_08405 [Sciscionella sp.]